MKLPNPPCRTNARWGAVLWAALTAGLLLAPGSALESGVSLPPLLEECVAWAVHFVLFAVLAWLVRAARPLQTHEGGDNRGSRVFVAVSALVVYCAALESLQLLVPDRSFQLLDIVFGCLGIWAGWRCGRAREAG